MLNRRITTSRATISRLLTPRCHPLLPAPVMVAHRRLRRITITARAITPPTGDRASTSTGARAITALGITDIGKAIIADIAGNGGYLSDVANGLKSVS